MLDIKSLITDSQWRNLLTTAVPEADHQQLSRFLDLQINEGRTIYPPQRYWFRAINDLPLESVKVVIIGQDPYHGEGQAHGLSFSVSQETKIPPSLRNIFKEQATDLGIKNESGDLSAWVKQGVLLLNTALTVEEGNPGSHSGKGWETITDAIIRCVSQQREQVVFMLWGAHAQKKSYLIDGDKHCVLQAPHPSPLSAHRGWFGCQHFSKANAYFQRTHQSEIDWRLNAAPQNELF